MGKMSDLAIELEEKEISLEEFRQQLKDLNDAVVNFQPPKKYQPMSKAKGARALGAFKRKLSSRRLILK